MVAWSVGWVSVQPVVVAAIAIKVLHLIKLRTSFSLSKDANITVEMLKYIPKGIYPECLGIHFQPLSRAVVVV